MKAMILAAGLGTRLLPLTRVLPKPLFPVLNRPLLEYTLDLLRANGIVPAAVNLHHLPEAIERHLRGRKGIHFSREPVILGTAGGIKAAQEFLDGGVFCVINGDILTDVDLRGALAFHEAKGACLTLVVREEPQPDKYPPIEIDSAGRIVRFPRANLPPSAGGRRVMFTGVQIMTPEIFARIPPGVFYGTTEDVFPRLLEEGRPVYGYLHTGYWNDVGNRESYLQAHWDLLDGKMRVAAPPCAGGPCLRPPVWIGAGCQLSPRAVVGPYAALGDGCIVEADAVVERSVCWERARVESGARVRASVLGAGAIAASGQEISAALVALTA